MSSRRPSQDDDIALVINIPDETPATLTNAQLSTSPVTTVISQAPLVESQRAGIIPTEANAIVYICVAVVAGGVTLWCLRSEKFPISLVLNLWVAFVVVISLCMILHLMPGGQLQP
jgi:hypothetical protein